MAGQTTLTKLQMATLDITTLARCWLLYLGWAVLFVAVTRPARCQKKAAAARRGDSAEDGSSSSINGDSWSDFAALRQASRLLASAVMYTVPPLVVLRQLQRWSPWCEALSLASLSAWPADAECEWCDPNSALQVRAFETGTPSRSHRVAAHSPPCVRTTSRHAPRLRCT